MYELLVILLKLNTTWWMVSANRANLTSCRLEPEGHRLYFLHYIFKYLQSEQKLQLLFQAPLLRASSESWYNVSDTGQFL